MIWGVANNMITNVADALALFFSGDKQLDEAIVDACKLFLKTFEGETFICKGCGEIIFPKVTVNEHGIFVSDTRNEIRGGLANRLLKQNICEKCAENMMKVPEDLINKSLCDSCVHSEICRFEVPAGKTCEHYTKGWFL